MNDSTRDAITYRQFVNGGNYSIFIMILSDDSNITILRPPRKSASVYIFKKKNSLIFTHMINISLKMGKGEFCKKKKNARA